MQRLQREHGVRVFARGAAMRVLWMAPRTALSFTVYESLRPLLD